MSKNNKTTEPTAPQALTAQFSEQIIDERLTPNPLSQFSMDNDALRLALVTAQYALRATRQQTPPILNKPTGYWYWSMVWSRQARVPLSSNCANGRSSTT
ncbi:hypothetical protein [Psychrobacter sp. JCM 18903]|uniref:hypothetical protein n=1 Tax=Psychrobacter sp. JCM 18903 TaxID=1298610 RepID=UPI0004B3E95B|nr:hypothetical protein [Psychrobacter sp. JCM 18903]